MKCQKSFTLRLLAEDDVNLLRRRASKLKGQACLQQRPYTANAARWQWAFIQFNLNLYQYSHKARSHLSLGQRGGVLQHVHDDGKQLVHPLPHLQTAHLGAQGHAGQSQHRDFSGVGEKTFILPLNGGAWHLALI